MRRFALALLLTSALPAPLGLAGPPDLPSKEAPAPYDGPPLEIALEVAESVPLQYAVTVQGKMPGPGYTLRILSKTFDGKAKATLVYVSLTEHRMKPPEGASTAAGDVLKARLDLGPDVGHEIRVLIRLDNDLPTPDHSGPPFRLAKVLEIPG
jgi:hypothetical protein